MLDAKKKYLIGVSGGPDSMALLDLANKETSNLVVVHVNYKKRKTSDRDERLVRKYCKDHNIKLYVKTLKEEYNGNFQDFARVFRYSFFKEIYDKEKCDVLLIAHNQDDYIETYLLKSKKGSRYDELALSKKTFIYNMHVYRPLINKPKKSLEEYCVLNNVKYGIDETNLTDLYERNRIRKQVQKMSNKERKELLQTIKRKCLENDKLNKQVSKAYKEAYKNKELDIKKVSRFNQDIRLKIMYKFLVENSNIYPANLSKNRLLDILEKCDSNKAHVSIILSNEEKLVRNNQKIRVAFRQEDSKFSYTISSLKSQEFKEFKLAKKGKKMEGIYVSKDELPLTIRSYKSTDIIKVNEGHKKISRLFIDAKIPLEERNKIPIVETKNGEIILVSGVYQEMEHKLLQSNMFVLKC